MKWFVNDLSLQRQFQSESEFLEVLRGLLKLRAQSKTIGDSLYCSTSLREAPVTANLTFRQTIQKSTDPVLRRAVLDWVTTKGPFWEVSRVENADDYFEVHGRDATETGVGEAARRRLNGTAASTYSFHGAEFDYSPLDVTHGLPDAPINKVDLLNLWGPAQLIAAANEQEGLPQNWGQVIERARRKFDRLSISPYIEDYLRGEPFIPYVAERIFELLRVLEEFVASRNDDGTYSDETQRLISEHFSGGKAWFSGESDSNESNFKNELTFKSFIEGGEDKFCPWHGKIKTPQYRIHFPWPMDSSDKVLEIHYIGPKITKR